MPKITVIPSTINPLTKTPINTFNKRRVCAYARVSTDSDEQLTSYEAQQDYYTKYIKANPNWKFVKVYTDEGISGTNTKNRAGFNQMIEDALNGEIDLIVTKSVSRFARNTVDSLTTIRKLKDKGVECFFEKENIYTFDSKGELLLTIMSSLAQEESRSISQNVTWGKRKAFSDGKVSMSYKNFLGYKKGEDGKPIIVPEEAEIIKRIYSLFLEGYSLYGIAEMLNKDNVRTPSNRKGTKWTFSSVKSILTNEKYKGDALLQKTYVESYLTHKAIKNKGEVDQYYVKGNHEAIIEPSEWEMVQAELERRKKYGSGFNCTSIFSNKIVCGDCGGFYGQKVWHSNDPWRKVIWRCNRKYDNDKHCNTPTLDEETIKASFVKAFNELSKSKHEVINDAKEIILFLDNREELDKKIASLEAELEIVCNLVEKLVKSASSNEIDTEEYQEKYGSYEKKYNDLVTNLDALKEQRKSKTNQIESINLFIINYEKEPKLITEFDEGIWRRTIEQVKAFEDYLEFEFISGNKIKIEL